MSWKICFVIAALILIFGIMISILTGKSGNKRKRMTKPFYLLFGTVFTSAVIMFIPVYNEIFAGEPFGCIKVLLLAFHNTIRLFIVDGEFSVITDHITISAGWIFTAYTLLAAVIFVFAPMLTFGVVLSFFKNVSAYQKYLFCYFRDVYIFSELNEKSLALASSICKHDRRRRIVFTDVFEEDGEASYELTKRAQELDAVCFKNDMMAIDFRMHSQKKNLFFFAIGEDESENIDQALKLIPIYRDRDHTHLYVFSARVDSELLFTSVDKGAVRVRRVNDVRALVNRLLYDDGRKIFENAVSTQEGIKEISAVVIGMGQYGTTMAKALSWFCQMDGYRISIDVFEKDELAKEKFEAQCPELMSEDYNGVYVSGEAQYLIRIHENINVDTRKFAEEIQKLDKATYVFVALGSDEENIRVAVYLRMLFERNGLKPSIQTIVYNSSEKKALRGITNYQGQPYAIDFVGDLETCYSEQVIMDSELEAEALQRHIKWGEEEEFWKYEYNYRSSVACAIHMKAREWCRIPGAEKKEEELTLEEKTIIEALEHRRWNAYMRSEGYIYSGSPEKSSRNDLGKMHHDLVCFSELTEKEKRKDSRVGTK